MAEGVASLIDHHCRAVGGVLVQPTGHSLRHIDATVATVASKRLVATAIIVREIGAGAVVGAPPAIVEVVSTIVIFHGEVDIGVGIPERRSLGFTGFELGR